MAKLIEYDVSDVEESSGGTGVKVKPGLKVAKIMKVSHRTEKRDGSPANDLEVALSFGDEYDWAFTYIGLEKSSDWKLAEFTRALGLPPKGKINPDLLTKNKPIIRVKVNSGEYQGNYSPDVGRLMAAQKGDEFGSSISETAVAAEAAEAEDEEGTAEDENVSGNYAEGFEPSRESDPEIGSYDEWADDDLLAEVEDRGLTLPGGRGSKRDKAIAALRAEDTEAEGGGDVQDEDPGDDTDGDGDEYDTWPLEDLVKEYEDRNFEEPTPSFKGRNAAERTKNAIVEALREDDNASPFEA